MTVSTKLEAFKEFAAEREEAGDWHLFVAPGGMKLVRTKICDQCRFPRSTIYQDDAIVQFLEGVERQLREQGLLKTGHAQPVAETLDELEKVIEKSTNVALADADGLLVKCRTLAEKLAHLSQYHPAYPVQDNEPFDIQ